MKLRALLSLSFATCACMFSFVLKASPTDRWPMYQANASHSGFVAKSILVQFAQPRWSVQAQTTVPSGLAISDGYVFTTPLTYFDEQAPLIAQSIDSGEIAWSVNFGPIFSVNQPAIDSGRIYLQTSNNEGETYLHCYGIDGSFQWRSPFNSQWERYLGPIVVDGNLYFDGGTYGGLYSFSSQDGEMQWYTQLQQYDLWSPTWANGKLLVFTQQLDIIAPSTGQILGTILDPDYQWSGWSANQAPVVVGDLAFAINGGRLIAFDLNQLTISWTRNIAASGQVATDGQQIFVTAGGALSVRDPANGNAIWSWVPSPSGGVTTNLVVTRSHVIAGDNNNTYLVNRTTHQTDHVFPVSGMLAYAADTLVVATTQGNVVAFDLPTDELFANSYE